MANRSEFGRAGPQTGRAPRATWLPVATLAALALIAVACTETDSKPLTAPPSIGGPNFAADVPFNAGDKCIAADAFLSGFTNGVNDSLKLASDKLCVSNDIRIAQAVVDSISTDGGINYVKFTGQNVSCSQGDILFLQMAARVAETATSQRTDIGIWIGLNGGNARVGQCNHYNLVSQGIPLGQTVAGVTNVEGDQCGDMNAGDTTLVQLGKIQVLCQTATPTDTLVHIGSCLGWTQPGGDQTCPQNPPGGANGFRWGTAPGTGSKCNCEGFNVPITVKQFAKLEVVKACVPSQITGATFDLLIDGVTTTTPSSDNVACGGTTGAQELDAGTNANPGKQHSHGEGDFGGGFTSSDYTIAFACVNRGTNVSRGSGTSLGPNNITLQPNDDVVCTYTNTLKPRVKLVKVLNPTTDGGKFDFTLAGTGFDNGGAGYGHNGTTGFQIVSIGSVSFSEAAHTGTSLTDYLSALECRNAADQVVASNPNGTNTAGSVTVAAGDQITCTFTNTRKPQVKLVKQLSPTNDAGKFDFTLAGTPFNNGGAGYGHNGTTGFQNVAIGSVSFSEAAHTGTLLSDYTTALECRNAADQVVTSNPNGTNTAGSVTVAAGDQITCTFVNTKGAVLKLVKVLDPTTEGGKFDFTIAGTSFDNSGTGFGHNGTTGFQPVALGSVSFSEAAHTGTSLTNYTTVLSCVNAASQTVASNPNGTNTAGSVTVGAGDQITCTFTNTRKPQLKLVKVLNPTTDGGKFDFTLAGNPFDNGGAGYGHNGTTGFQNVAIGSVSFSEAAHTGTSLTDYLTALECRNAADQVVASNPNGTNTAGSVTTAAGDQITCTFTNTRKPQVKLVKQLNPTNDAGKFDFTLAGTGFDNGGAGYGHNGTTGFQNVSIGSVSFSESAHTGTSLTDYTTALSCVNSANQTVASNPNGTNTAGSVTVAAGDQITCTFLNTKGAVLKLVKLLNPTTDGGKFDFTIAGTSFDNSGAGFGHNGTTGFQPVALGSVSFSEAGHTGTSLSDYGSALACLNAANQTVASNPNATNTAGSVTVGAGDVITCTFTNTHKATITVAKACTGGSGATFGYSLSGPSGPLSGFNRDCGASAIAVPATTAFGTYTINETTIPSGWAFDQLSCTGGGGNTSTLGSTATVGLDAGENVTCTYTNKVQGRAQIAPTATTCEQFAAGTSQTLADLLATVNGGKIQTVSPGVFFYYAEVIKGAGQSVGFAQSVSPNPAGLPLYEVQQGQAFLYSVSGGVCTKVATLTLNGGVWSGGAGLAAGSYILGVKFTPEAAKGLSVPGFGAGALLATHNYSLTVNGAPAGGQASVNTRVKP